MRKLKLEELDRVTPETYKTMGKLPITLVLDNIRSAANVGSMFRTCDGFGYEQLILCGITAVPPHKEINKTAIGATKSVEWVHRADVGQALEELKGRGVVLIGVEQTDESESLSTYKFPIDKEIALVFGNEINGLSDETLPYLDACLEIPQYGTKHSFNVSVCAGMIMWEASRQLRG